MDEGELKWFVIVDHGTEESMGRWKWAPIADLNTFVSQTSQLPNDGEGWSEMEIE